MHTYQYSEDISFLFNSDLSGDVLVVIPAKSVEPNVCNDNRVDVAIPGTALLEFVANYIRNTKVSELESMTTEQLLNVKIY